MASRRRGEGATSSRKNRLFCTLNWLISIYPALSGSSRISRLSVALVAAAVSAHVMAGLSWRRFKCLLTRRLLLACLLYINLMRLGRPVASVLVITYKRRPDRQSLACNQDGRKFNFIAVAVSLWLSVVLFFFLSLLFLIGRKRN